MPKLEVEGMGSFDVEGGKRLVLAIEEDAGVDIMHVCGQLREVHHLPHPVPGGRAGGDDPGGDHTSARLDG
jgi:hypothetical protein